MKISASVLAKLNESQNVYPLKIDIQYMYIVKKYKIYLYKLQKQVERQALASFWFVSHRVQINNFFLPTMYIYCV